MLPLLLHFNLGYSQVYVGLLILPGPLTLARFGAKLYACSDALAAQGVDRMQLIREVAGLTGAAAFVQRALDPEWSTLVF